MISEVKFVKDSLHLNLFFLRIMKEHSIFLAAALPPKNSRLINQAESFKNLFTMLLSNAVYLSHRAIDTGYFRNNEFVTKYTLPAEKITQSLSGIMIDSNVTLQEYSLKQGLKAADLSMLSKMVYALNQKNLNAVYMIIRFKTSLKNQVMSCKVFTNFYPSLLEHILEEAEHYYKALMKLQKGMDPHDKKEMAEEEAFWDEKMSDHAFAIRGLLDPEEKELFKIADSFGKEFDALKKELSVLDKTSDLSGLTEKTLVSTKNLRDFKEQGTEGILKCQIKSIIIPLLADHVLREANHYINLLESYS